MIRSFVAAAFVLLLAPSLAWAQSAPRPAPRPAPAPSAPAAQASRPAAERVALQVWVVHATDAEQGVDPRLAPLASSFRYLKYQGYRLLSTQSAELPESGDATFTVEGGRRLTLTLVSADDARARVRAEMTNAEGKVLDTTVSINRDGTFVIAGPRYQDGILILPIRASY